MESKSRLKNLGNMSLKDFANQVEKIEEVEKFDIRKTLSEEEVKILDEFKQKIEEDLTSERRRAFCSEITCVRYLRARKWEIAKAKKMLQETLEWREKFKPEEITLDDVKVKIYFFFV